ncbi:hypothetical protein ACIRL2_35350 [Embleya sp. NPDC127516]|uniref:hypothetical protein n=1 Tax=Embleya sp. NPDC127516 TaxID=3363990 RepID=UPI00380C0802
MPLPTLVGTPHAAQAEQCPGGLSGGVGEGCALSPLLGRMASGETNGLDPEQTGRRIVDLVLDGASAAPSRRSAAWAMRAMRAMRATGRTTVMWQVDRPAAAVGRRSESGQPFP